MMELFEIEGIYEFFKYLLVKLGIYHYLERILYLPEILIYLIMGLTLFGGIVIIALYLSYLERKFIGHIQVRLGPMRVGPHGFLQPIADFLKFLQKEEIIPEKSDKLFFIISPLLVFVPAFITLSLIPLGRNLFFTDFSISLLLVFSISSASVLGVILAGWSSNNKYSILGGMRTAAQLISYELPLVLAVITVVILSGSLNLQEIVKAQGGYFLSFIPKWYIFYLPVGPIGALILFISSLAEMGRTPFDLPEAESELVAGYNTEFCGVMWAFFMFSEYIHLIVGASLLTLLYLGGWQGPLLPSFIWFGVKVIVIILLIMWIRATIPRVRIDQLLSLSWKVLLPLGILNIFITGLVVLWF